MASRIRFGRVFGFEVNLDWSWFLVVALFGWVFSAQYARADHQEAVSGLHWVMGYATALILFACVLLHELMHSVVARREGLAISGITLFFFGGVSEMRDEPDSAKHEFLMAFAGPATSALLGVLFLLAAFGGRALGLSTPVVRVLRLSGTINFALAIFNLLPGFPLDGGRVLRAVLWQATKNLRRATYISSRVGVAMGLMLIFLGVFFLVSRDYWNGIWLGFLGFLLKEAAEQGYQQVLLKRALAGVRVEQVMSRPVVAVSADLPIDALIEQYFMRYRFHTFPVEEGGRLIGVVSLDEVKTVPRAQWMAVPVRAVMRTDILADCITPQDTVDKALSLMVQKKVGQIPVCSNGQSAGMITRRDIMEVFRLRTDLGEGSDQTTPAAPKGPPDT